MRKYLKIVVLLILYFALLFWFVGPPFSVFELTVEESFFKINREIIIIFLYPFLVLLELMVYMISTNKTIIIDWDTIITKIKRNKIRNIVFVIIVLAGLFTLFFSVYLPFDDISVAQSFFIIDHKLTVIFGVENVLYIFILIKLISKTRTNQM